MRIYSFEISKPNSIDCVADWLELSIVINKNFISKSETKSFVEKALTEEPSEAFIDDVWGELERRSQLYGKSVPFKLKEDYIECAIDWEENPEYLACLIFSFFGNKKESSKSGKIFERVCNEAIRNYLQAETIIFGFPTKQKLKDIVQVMQEKLKEKPRAKFKDRGVDIFSWKPFDDGRSSKLVILFQCASGTNWRKKTRDISLTVWREYVSFASSILKGFCLPSIPNEEDFIDCTREAGIIIDRARIFRFTFRKLNKVFKRELKTWCNGKLREFSS